LKLRKIKSANSFLSTSIFVAAIFTFINPSSFSQTRVDSLEYLGNFTKINLFNTRFDKQLNTFHLYSQLQLYGNIDRVQIRINENYGSTFIRNETKNTRDEQHFNLNTKYLLQKNFSLGILGSSSILSDNRSLGINESVVNYASIFTELEPIDRLRLNPFGGYSRNTQVGITDNGPMYGFEGILDRINFTDVNINSELRYRNEDILPRRNMIRFFGLSVGNYFDRNISNTIRTFYSQNRKDFYFEADSITSAVFNIENNIQSRIETAYQIFDRLSYGEFLDVFSLDLSGGIIWRTIDRDNRYQTAELLSNQLYSKQIDELKLELESAIRYASKSFDGILRLSFNERDEKHLVKRSEGMSETIYEQKSELEEQQNNNSSRAIISFLGNYKISRTDQFTFSLYQSKLVYDTQSELNDDDRDEILSIVRLRYSKLITPYFSGFVNAEGTFAHTVYLFASRSSNNNQNRVIRLRAGGEYAGKNIKSFNSFEVSANYTVYDYEDITTNYQSYSFRQFTAIDSTTISLKDNASLFIYGYLKLSEIGDFNWDNFSDRPTRFLEELYLEPRFILNYERTMFSIGLRLFLLNTYSYNENIRVLSSEYLSLGPISMIDIFASNNLNIVLRGYYEFITNTNIPNKQQASLFAQINWKF
jgi:hypothetical protein